MVAPTPPPPPPPPPVIWRRMPIPQCPPPVIGAGCAPPQGLDTRARARARTVPISQSPLVRARLGPPRLELPPCRRLSQSGLPRARPCVVSGVLASQCALVCPRRGRGRGFGCRRGQPAQPRGVGSGPPWWGGGGSVRWAGGCTVGGLPLYAMTYSEDVLFFLLLVAAPSGGDAWTGEPHAPAQPTARRGGCALGGPWGGGGGGVTPSRCRSGGGGSSAWRWRWPLAMVAAPRRVTRMGRGAPPVRLCLRGAVWERGASPPSTTPTARPAATRRRALSAPYEPTPPGPHGSPVRYP